MCAARVQLKDRILEGVSKAVKEVQAFSCDQSSERVAVTNDDRPLQKLVECLDHALLHGLRHITPGYWAIVKKFTHKDIVSDISKLDRLTTHLGRSRAWLYQALNDIALESYIRCFIEHRSTTRKYYVENSLMRDEQRLVLLQTLVSGLDFVTFELQINIAYFDLVSHIPRSANNLNSSHHGDTEDRMSIHSWDDTISDTSGVNLDIDEISLASSEACTPGELGDKEINLSWSNSPDGIVETWTTQEKRHSSFQIVYDTNGITKPHISTEANHSAGLLRRSNSDIPIIYSESQDFDKKVARPASLATTSRIERLSSISPSGGKSIEDVNQEELVVIRLKGKKKRKGKKKKGTSLSQGSTPTCASGITLGLMKEEDIISLELDDEGRSDLLPQGVDNQDKRHSSIPSLPDADTEESLKQPTNDLKSTLSGNSTSCSPSENHSKSRLALKGKLYSDNPHEKQLNYEAGQHNADYTDSGLSMKQDAEFESPMGDGDSGISMKQTAEFESSVADGIQILSPNPVQEHVQPQNTVQSNSLATQLFTKTDKISQLPKTSSLDYDTTIEYSLTSVDSIAGLQSSSNQLLQVQFDRSLDDSGLSNVSIDDPSYTNLLLTNTITASSTPVTEQLSSELHQESTLGMVSSMGCKLHPEELVGVGEENLQEGESGHSTPIGERSSPEGIDSPIVVAREKCEADSDITTEAPTRVESYKADEALITNINTCVQGDVGIKFHPAEIIVDNNAKLYLMLEIFKNEHEEFKKLLRMSTGHTEGDLEPVFVMLTDQAIYLLRRGERMHRYLTETGIAYNHLDYISVGVHYQTIQLVCTNRRNQYWLNTGDEQLSRYFLQELVVAMEDGSRTRSPPSILTDATTQLISMQKFAAKECRTTMQDAKVHLYSLIHWEDLVDSATAADMQLYQPTIVKEGRLQYKTHGSFLVGSYWKDSYFILRNETFYRFGHKRDKEPELAVQLRTQHFGGCRRVRSGDRQFCFELILKDGTSLEVACQNETDVSNWLQAICSVVAQGVMLQHQGKTHSPCQPCCSVIADSKLLICHEDCQTNFYRSLASCDIADISTIAVDVQVQEYIILEFQPPDNPWVIHFNCAKEKGKFMRTIGCIWKQSFQVDLPVHEIDEDKVQKRCRECLMLIQSSWQRCDSITRGRIGGKIW